MKTATVTWTTDNNYGTLLQAYALQQKIVQMGHENVILSDSKILDEIHTQNFKQRKNQIEAQQESSLTLTQRLLRLAKNPGRIWKAISIRIENAKKRKYEHPYYAVQNKCNDFREKQLNILNLSKVPEKTTLDDLYDAFVCGSDQIWSVLAHRFHPYYFLQFTGKKKIAYAPSMGTTKICDEDKRIIQDYLSSFNVLSVREKQSAVQLTELLQRDVDYVADPTMLHTADFWKAFAKNNVKRRKPYLLCYFLENKPWYFEYAEKIAKRNHFKILLIPNKIEFSNSKYLIRNQDIGPQEFVGLFANASAVITDSYHGSIFSILFEKEFSYLLRFTCSDPRSQNIRIQSLFDQFGLNGRIVEEHTPIDTELPPIDYKQIAMERARFQKKSEEFLSCALNSLGGGSI